MNYLELYKKYSNIFILSRDDIEPFHVRRLSDEPQGSLEAWSFWGGGQNISNPLKILPRKFYLYYPKRASPRIFPGPPKVKTSRKPSTQFLSSASPNYCHKILSFDVQTFNYFSCQRNIFYLKDIFSTVFQYSFIIFFLHKVSTQT